jgi:hypothetical protein
MKPGGCARVGAPPRRLSFATRSAAAGGLGFAGPGKRHAAPTASVRRVSVSLQNADGQAPELLGLASRCPKDVAESVGARSRAGSSSPSQTRLEGVRPRQRHCVWLVPSIGARLPAHGALCPVTRALSQSPDGWSSRSRDVSAGRSASRCELRRPPGGSVDIPAIARARLPAWR